MAKPSSADPLLLVTGASGLLGRALLETAAQRGWRVLAQYHTRPVEAPGEVTWLPADLSTLEGIAAFISENEGELRQCD